jgi:hypothetical protein
MSESFFGQQVEYSLLLELKINILHRGYLRNVFDMLIQFNSYIVHKLNSYRVLRSLFLFVFCLYSKQAMIVCMIFFAVNKITSMKR